MSLSSVISAELRKSVLARDDAKRNILKVLLGDIQTAESNAVVSDQQIVKIIQKIIKSNSETISLSEANAERIPILTKENEILSSFLPQNLTEQEIETLLVAQVEDIKSAKSDGQAMGIAMKFLKQSDLTKDKSVDNAVVGVVVKKFRNPIDKS